MHPTQLDANTEFPTASSITNWLSASALDELTNSRHVLTGEAGFQYGTIPDFFNLSVFQRLQRICSSVSNGVMENHPEGYHRYRVLPNRQVARFYLGHQLRDILAEYLNVTLRRWRENPLPQLYCTVAETHEPELHTDSERGALLVTILYVHERWSDGRGGELEFYARGPAGHSPLLRVDPVPNTLAYFTITDSSYHAVLPMHGAWERRALINDWEVA